MNHDAGKSTRWSSVNSMDTVDQSSRSESRHLLPFFYPFSTPYFLWFLLILKC
ncbi:hypothetical protein BDV25DRAFT_151550 [Aspergillus avenaceus]|uniref:Uncharacterized protein n=1 Tax=Aspergillus avenaceus TaxID=36643 RepID=A0A5N6U0I6_ASPAV|nr:hypothetical protein BDV25DRAFT_151550 [Aspergillus avenaceus]